MKTCCYEVEILYEGTTIPEKFILISEKCCDPNETICNKTLMQEILKYWQKLRPGDISIANSKVKIEKSEMGLVKIC